MEEKIVYEEREKKAGSGALALILIIIFLISGKWKENVVERKQKYCYPTSRIPLPGEPFCSQPVF